MPRGAYAHLCRLPDPEVGADDRARWRGSMPGACAASTRTGTPCSRATATIAADGKQPGGGRGELVDDEQPGPAGPQPGADDLRRSPRRSAASGSGRVRTAAPVRAHSRCDGERHRAVAVVGGERSRRRGAARATGARRPTPAVALPTSAVPSGSAPRKAGQVPAGVGDPVDQARGEEAQRVGLHLVAQPLLGALHGDRHRAERAVVEVADRRVEGEEQPGARESARVAAAAAEARASGPCSTASA